MKKLIYIVEDDDGVSELYDGALSGEYSLNLFSCGADFFASFQEKTPDLVILDIMLPDMDGLTILGKIREQNCCLPVIIVSAKAEELDFVFGLNKGADDYMAKPFSVLELLARVNAALRRGAIGGNAEGEKKKDAALENDNGFIVDENTYSISYLNSPLTLTLKEFLLLKFLLEKKGKTVSREDIFKAVWGEDFFGETRTLDIHIAAIREKLGEVGASPDFITTVRGVGYRFG